MSLSLTSTSSRKGPARPNAAAGLRSSPGTAAVNDCLGNMPKGALSGVIGASPFAVLATTPELPMSTVAASKSPAASSRHGHAGLSLRRVNSSSSNPISRTVSGSVTPLPPPSSRRGGGALRKLGVVVIILQLVVIAMLLARPSLFHKVTDMIKSSPALLGHHSGEQDRAQEGTTLAIITKLSADSRHAGAAGLVHASRRERLWPEAKASQAQQQQQGPEAVTKHETPTKPTAKATTTSTRTVQLVSVEKPVVTAAAAVTRTTVTGTTSIAAEAAAAATGTTTVAVDKKAAVKTAGGNVAAAAGAKAAAAGGAGTAVKAPIVTTGAGAKPTTAAAEGAKGVNKVPAAKAATVAASIDKKVANAPIQPAESKAGTSYPPFRVPVVRYQGRVANPPPIVGVIFYGRRDRVRILDCYLQRNMVRNGGLLTSVVFVTATWQPADVAFLDRLVALRNPDYRKLYPERLDKGYTGHYAWMDPATMYVKIDDDVVFIADHAIDHMLIAHNLNKYHLISANVVNHQPLELPHSQKGAHTQYEQARQGDKSSWRPVMRPVAQTSKAANGTTVTTAGPLQPVPYTDNGWDIWHDWRKAANVHYSFLANHAAGRLGVYEFPNGEELWDFNKHVGYTRWRINMIMFKGSTIDVHVYNMSSTVGTYPGDDEDYITRILPQQLNRTSAAVSKALAVHFSFYVQRAGLENSTDLLDRYALLAERTCGRLMPTD